MLLGRSTYHAGHLRKETKIHIQKVRREVKAKLSEHPNALLVGASSSFATTHSEKKKGLHNSVCNIIGCSKTK